MTGEISRQAFVRGALGATAGALLSACGSPTTPSPAGTSAGRVLPDWTALGKAVQGQLTLPSDASYAAAKSVFNARFDASTPAGVVAVSSISDIQTVLTFATDNGLKVTTRSGGHSYIGTSATDGAVVIDVRQLPGDIAYDSSQGLLTVPAAAQLDSVQTMLAGYGRSIPTGSCPTVGVAGLTLGGGLGSDARRDGLTCDALVSAKLVVPTGEVVTASANEHPDLFWALRGGGGGTCGVVTSFTFRTFPTTDRDVVTVVFPYEATARVVVGWHDWVASADRAIWGMVNITVAESARCTVVLATPPGGGPALAGELMSAIGVSPVSNNSQTLGRLDFVHYFEGGAQASRPRAFVAGSDIIGEMTPAAAQSIVAATQAWPSAAGSATAVIESLSGAVGDAAPGDSAFPWRRQAACVQWYTEAAVEPAMTWLAAAHAAVSEHSVGGYVNYLETGDPAARYFGENLARLTGIRQQYDPAGMVVSSLG
jgi:FAD/FMN-containing dehydrogenase